MKKFNQIICTIRIKLVVLHIKIEQIGVVSQTLWKVSNIFSPDLVLTNMKVLQWVIAFEKFHEIEETI